MTTSYNSDFYGWVGEQVSLLRSRQFNDLDLANLVEEIESMGRSEYDQLESRLTVLIGHLLKWQFQPNYRSASWQSTIREQRRKIDRLLKRSPSLKSKWDQALEEAWEDGRELALRETGLAESTFPEQPTYTWEEIQNSEFWP